MSPSSRCSPQASGNPKTGGAPQSGSAVEGSLSAAAATEARQQQQEAASCAAAAAPVAAAAAPAAAATKTPRGKRGGDPARRKEFSIHSLMRKLSLESKPAKDAAAAATSAAAATEAPAAAAAAAGCKETDEGPSYVEYPEEVSLFMFDFGECDAQRCSGRRLLRHHKLNKITSTGRVVYAQREGGRSSSSSRGDSASSSSSSSSSESELEEAKAAADGESPAVSLSAAAAAAAASSEGGGLLRVRMRGGRFKGILLSPYFDAKTPIFSRGDSQILRQHGLAVIDCSWNKVLEGRRAQQIDFLRQNVRVLPLLLCGNPTHYGAPNILNCAEALAGALLIAGYRRHANLLLSSFTWGSHFLSLNERYFDAYLKVSSATEMKKLQQQQQKELQRHKEAKETQKTQKDALSYAAVYTAVEDTPPNEADTP